jgi:hypothetical protein
MRSGIGVLQTKRPPEGGHWKLLSSATRRRATCRAHEKRPTLEDAGRNSNYGFSPSTIFGIWPAKMCEMLSRVIIRNAASYSVIWSGRTTGTVMPALVAGIHVLVRSDEERRGWPGQARP